jgi:hypothetical protein
MRFVAIPGLVALLFVLGACGGPEDDVAEYFEDMAEIMEDNMDDPEDGVEELRDYVRDNLPEALTLLGHVLVELDEIDDAEDRQERIEEVLEAMKEPMAEFQKAATKFFPVAYKDEDARKMLADFQKSWESTGEAFEKFARALGIN